MNDFEQIRQTELAGIAGADTVESLEKIRISLFGKKGSITGLLKQLKDVPVDQKKAVGQATNQLKNELQTAVESRKTELASSENNLPKFDVTLPGNPVAKGAIHPINQMIYELNDAFLSLGFEIYEGPEICTEQSAFDNLNFPEGHPARESMDTYWLSQTASDADSDRLCLRPHLTGASVQFMQENEPPFRFVYPGRVYRNEVTDARHERAFFQYEALIIDKDIPFSAGQLLIQTALSTVFGQKVETRMRVGFFPFVEPGFEIDMRCLVCGGPGCSVCKYVGWLEVMPGGAPHPNVLRAGNIDPANWTGFYISIGLDRMVMMRSGINDVRLFHGNDLRFLSQFK